MGDHHRNTGVWIGRPGSHRATDHHSLATDILFPQPPHFRVPSSYVHVRNGPRVVLTGRSSHPIAGDVYLQPDHQSDMAHNHEQTSAAMFVRT